jgi:hypothetical protein
MNGLQEERQYGHNGHQEDAMPKQVTLAEARD